MVKQAQGEFEFSQDALKPISQLNKSLQKVSAFFPRAANAWKIGAAANEKLAGVLGKVEKNNKEFNKSFRAFTSVLDIAIGSKLLTSIKAFDVTQRVALGMNQNLTSILGENTQALADLPGGYQDAVETQVLAFRSGFKIYNKDLTALGVRMKITGQNFQALFSSMAQLRVTGLLNNEATGRLSKHLEDTTKKYGISTDILVGAMSNLGEILKTTAALGTTEKLVGLQAELVGLLGAGSEGLVTSVLQGLSKADIGADVAAALGGEAATQARQELTGLGSLDMDAFLTLFEKVDNELGEFRRSFVGEGKLRAANLGFWTQIMGEGNLQLSLLAEKLGNLTEEERKIYDETIELNRSLQTLKEEALEPLIRVSASVLTALVKYSKVTMGLIKVLISLTVATKALILSNKLSKVTGVGSTTAGHMSKVFGILGPLALIGGAAALIGGIWSQVNESRKQTKIQEKIKRADEQTAELAKNREERETASSNKYALMTSNTLRAVLQLNALMPEFAAALANNTNERQTAEIIKEIKRTNVHLYSMDNAITVG